MRINHLHVTNFRGFSEAEFDFRRSVDSPPGNGSFHVLIGHNGAGKTSILEALAVAAGGWFQGIRADDARHIEKRDIHLQVHQHGTETREELQYPVRVEAEGRAMEQDVRWARELRAAGRRTNTKESRALQIVAAEAGQNVMSGQAQDLPLISYYGTGRLWQEPRTREEKRLVKKKPNTAPGEIKKNSLPNYAPQFRSRLAGYRYSVDPRCSPSDLIDWLHMEALVAAQTGQESQATIAVKNAVRKSFEGCEGVEFNLKVGKLLLNVAAQGKKPFSILSDGQRNLVAMIGDIAWKAAQLNPHLGDEALERTPGIVLIDELDLHLHPEWQRLTVERLRELFPQIQFIATTHSPFVVQALREGELTSLDQQPVPMTGNLSVEEISRGLMGVAHPETSPRYREMVSTAKDFLLTLEQAATAPEERLAEFKQRLASGIELYADNPAFQAFLELKQEAKLGSRNGNSHATAVEGAQS